MTIIFDVYKYEENTLSNVGYVEINAYLRCHKYLANLLIVPLSMLSTFIQLTHYVIVKIELAPIEPDSMKLKAQLELNQNILVQQQNFINELLVKNQELIEGISKDNLHFAKPFLKNLRKEQDKMNSTIHLTNVPNFTWMTSSLKEMNQSLPNLINAM